MTRSATVKIEPKKSKKKTRLVRTAVAATTLSLAHLVDSAFYHNIPHTFMNNTNEEFVVGKNSKHLQGLSEVELERKHNIILTGGVFDTPLNDFYAEDIDVVLQKLTDEKVPMRKAIRKIVLVPEGIKTDYSGGAGLFGVMYLHTSSQDAIIHEIAHLHSYKLGSDFWNKWNASRTKDVRYPRLGMLANKYDSIFGKETADDFKVSNGFVSDYSQMTVDEDLAEFVEDCYKSTPEMQKVNFEERDLYIKRIDLLREYGFLSEARAELSKKRVAIDDPLLFEQYARQLFSHVTPKPLEFIEGSDGISLKLADVEYKGLKGIVAYDSRYGGSGLSFKIQLDEQVHINRSYSPNYDSSETRFIQKFDSIPKDVTPSLHKFFMEKGFFQEWSDLGFSRDTKNWDSISKEYDTFGVIPHTQLSMQRGKDNQVLGQAMIFKHSTYKIKY
jgi:hypothetical protein